MNASRRDLGSDLARVDARSVTDDDLTEAPEFDEAWFDRAVPNINGVPVRRGRPKLDDPKVQVNIRLSSDVVKRFKASGRGWQTRIDVALAEWLANHPDVGGA